MTWWGWVIAGAILLGAELSFVSAQFYLVFIGSAAILVGLATLALPLADWLQWALFALLAIVSMVAFRSRIYRRVHGTAPAVHRHDHGTAPARNDGVPAPPWAVLCLGGLSAGTLDRTVVCGSHRRSDLFPLSRA